MIFFHLQSVHHSCAQLSGDKRRRRNRPNPSAPLQWMVIGTKQTRKNASEIWLLFDDIMLFDQQSELKVLATPSFQSHNVEWQLLHCQQTRRNSELDFVRCLPIRRETVLGNNPCQSQFHFLVGETHSHTVARADAKR